MTRKSDRDGQPRPTDPPKPEEVNGTTQEVHERDWKLEYAKGKEAWGGKLKKPEAAVPGSGQAVRCAAQDPFAADYPALVAFIADREWEDGSRRIPGSIILFVQDGQYTACLTEKNSPFQVAFQAARTVAELLSRVEAGLRAGTLDWRAQRGGKGGGR